MRSHLQRACYDSHDYFQYSAYRFISRMLCTYCGATISEGSQACGHCGAPLTAMPPPPVSDSPSIPRPVSSPPPASVAGVAVASFIFGVLGVLLLAVTFGP